MIRGNRINLRTVREKDLERLFELDSDIANRGEYFPLNLPSEPGFMKRFRENGFWSDDFGRLLIVDKEDDQILGYILFFKPVAYFDALEIGYILHDESRRGQGITSEALRLMVRLLFETHKVNRLQLTVMVGNAASKRVAEKCGFQSEGILRQAVFQKGHGHDLEIFSLVREDYDSKSK